MKLLTRLMVLLAIIVSILIIFTACDDEKESPLAPPIPAIPTELTINHSITGFELSVDQPFVFHVYDNINNLTTQSNPLYIHKTGLPVDNATIGDIPAGTYYLLIFWDQNKNGKLDECMEMYSIYLNFSWEIEQPLNATPIVITVGSTTTLDLNLSSRSFYMWQPYGCEMMAE